MADRTATSLPSPKQQIQSLQLKLQAALKLAESEKRKREIQFSEASAKIAKAEKELAKSKAEASKLMSPRKAEASSEEDFDESGAITFLGCPMHRRTAKLILANGKEFIGFSFGAESTVSGEIVFNTGMVGYPEALTDPSYRGQILILTYPLVGNYGVPDEAAKDDFGLAKFMESDEIHIKALIVLDYSHDHSHWNAHLSLGEWLRNHNIPALYGIDTRMLTKQIRTAGALLGCVSFGEKPVAFEDPNLQNLVAQVATKEVRVYGKGNSPKIIAFDCGMKYNIIRYFVSLKCELMVVPYDHDLAASQYAYDGIFISNGPGDPTMAGPTIESIRWAISQKNPVPVFGICLGNQILALAAGAKTYKMKFGNRGMNQPCIDMRTARCYITPQNHGFAVDERSLPPDWKPLFANANDYTNEGIVHKTKPFFSVQFHPEACGGPMDTNFLFDIFLKSMSKSYEAGERPGMEITTLKVDRFRYRPIRKVVLIGSGGLSIGQAGEFDYSGSQAIKALKQENIQVVVVNPNIATVQTSKGMADKVYFLPVTAKYVLQVIEKEKPDGVLVAMGGQTALNVGCELYESGALDKHNVRVLGTQIEAIKMTEDREAFAECLKQIGESCARSTSATTVAGAVLAAKAIGYPVLVRAAYALGGLGSGFAADEAELRQLAKEALAASPQILVDQDLRGWKEVEYEVVRDVHDNCITVCNMENFDPLGIHTGDSIVVAPSQTLSNREYFNLRRVSIKVVRHLGVVGECNIQFALDPASERYCIIEVNARLSRSSALASKATGYPLAYIATKLALGKDLMQLRNSVTKTTTACFEPALDYVVVKMPRWDLKKFDKANTDLGSSMKSVGEVMAIGRKFEETFQKALRMVDPTSSGFTSGMAKPVLSEAEAAHWQGTILEKVRSPSPERVHQIAQAFDAGCTVAQVHRVTRIDPWFLHKLKRMSNMMATVRSKQLPEITAAEMQCLKSHGFSDRAIAEAVGVAPMAVRKTRVAANITPFVKQIDTLAAEFPAQTNYLYATYNATEHDVVFPASRATSESVIVLGCGAYCIGSSVEFDWCAVSAVKTLQKENKKAIVINYNPETVSTDFDESDRLYFEELTLERVLDVVSLENPQGVMVSVGGQIPNNLSMPLFKAGVPILGTSPQMIDMAEDRNKFSSLLDKLGVDQPQWAELREAKAAQVFCASVGFPVLVRPSYVLSGAAMRVVANEAQLRAVLGNEAVVNAAHPVVISKFIEGAKEIEYDGVAQAGRILNYAISEHVENAGVHSGDATLLLPAQKLYVETTRRVKRIAREIAQALVITGPFNIQFIARENSIKVIECNLRASRSFPFVSKVLNANFITLATRAMLLRKVIPYQINVNDLDYVGCKAPMFSFTRLKGADPIMGVEMASTGEVACFGADKQEAFLLAIISAGFKMPVIRSALISIGKKDENHAAIKSVEALYRDLNFKIHCTPGTGAYFNANSEILKGNITILEKSNPKDTTSPDSAYHHLTNAKLDLVFIVPSHSTAEVSSGYAMRRNAADFGINLITNLQLFNLLVAALRAEKERKRGMARHVSDFYAKRFGHNPAVHAPPPSPFLPPAAYPSASLSDLRI